MKCGKTSTDGDGKYSINVEKGTYIIEFIYDKNIYNTTEYQKGEAKSFENSDGIGNVFSNNIVTTDSINLKNNKRNIDLGLVKKENKNLIVQKNIKQINIKNNSNTKTYNCEEQDGIAKINLKKEELKNSILELEYEITVKNESNSNKKIQNILEYKPDDLTYSENLNSSWEENNGILYNSSFENEIIKPYETKKIKLILTKQLKERKYCIDK